MTSPEPTPTKAQISITSRVRLTSRDLFRGGRELVILHGGNEYLLRITRADKLILTK